MNRPAFLEPIILAATQWFTAEFEMKRRSFKRPRRRSAGRSAFRMAKAALGGVKKLRRERETKRIDVTGSITIATLATSTSAHPLSTVAQGDGEGNRDGTDIRPTSLFFRLSMETNPSSVLANLIRVVVFRDNDPSGVAPTAGMLLERNNVRSPLESDNSTRFKVLWDRLVILDEGIGPRCRFYKKYIRLSGRMKYQGVTGNAADQGAGANSLWLLLATESATNLPLAEWDARMNFQDP